MEFENDYSNKQNDDYILLEPTKKEESEQTNKKKSAKKLSYHSLKDISFLFFLKESFLFSINFIVDRAPLLVAFLCARYVRNSDLIEVIGSGYMVMFYLTSYSVNHQETIGIILGPFYSNGDKRNYYLYLYRIIFMSILIFALNIGSILIFRNQILTFFSVNDEIFDRISDFIFWQLIFIAPAMTIMNLMRGLSSVHQLQKYYFYINMWSFFCIVFIYWLLIIQLRMTEVSFIICVTVKMMSEAIISLILVLKNSTL